MAASNLSFYRVEVAAEELFEMLGASFILYGLLSSCRLIKNKRERMRRVRI